jgi:putative sigma-54 modulation protein
MKIETTGRNVPIDDRLRLRAEKKLAKLTKFLSEPIEARVTFALEKHLHVAEIFVSHRDGSLRATEHAEGHLIEALDLAIDSIQNQGRRTGDKQKNGKRRRGGSPQEPAEILESGSELIAPE